MPWASIQEILARFEPNFETASLAEGPSSDQPPINRANLVKERLQKRIHEGLERSDLQASYVRFQQGCVLILGDEQPAKEIQKLVREAVRFAQKAGLIAEAHQDTHTSKKKKQRSANR